ncbi:MAG: hypothetical protein AB1610_00245 [Nitrospirota bacterium]
MNEIKLFFTLSEDAEDRIRVTAIKEKGEILKFIVQYEAKFKSQLPPPEEVA